MPRGASARCAGARPAEPLGDFQLDAQALRPGRAGAGAAWGDGGPWDSPTRAEFPAGGHEADFAFRAPETEDRLRAAIASRLARGAALGVRRLEAGRAVRHGAG